MNIQSLHHNHYHTALTPLVQWLAMENVSFEHLDTGSSGVQETKLVVLTQQLPFFFLAVFQTLFLFTCLIKGGSASFGQFSLLFKALQCGFSHGL